MSELVEIVTTLESESEAEAIAAFLVDARLAACAQWKPIRSCYRWKGRVTTAGEFELTLKTREELVTGLVAVLREKHPYEVPAILVLAVERANSDYVEWVHAETREVPGE